MFKNNTLKALEKRISALEKELNTVISALSAQIMGEKNTNSYEEVITEWLCGKETA